MAHKIDIDPATGTPIVSDPDDKMPVSNFVSQVQAHLDENSDEKKAPLNSGKSETIPASGPGNPAPQHAHLIKAAKEFNENLHRPPATFGIPYPIQMNIGIEAQIRSVLKDNGMDTQQQEKAMLRIAEILSTAKRSESQ